MRGTCGKRNTRWHTHAHKHGSANACRHTCTGRYRRTGMHARTHKHTHTHTRTRKTHSGMKQTQSVGYTDMISSLWVWLVMSVRGYDCSCLCSSCEFEECLFRTVGLVPFSQVCPPFCAGAGLHAWPWPLPPARGQVIVPSKATAGVGHPAWGCHMSLSPLSPWQLLADCLGQGWG